MTCQATAGSKWQHLQGTGMLQLKAQFQTSLTSSYGLKSDTRSSKYKHLWHPTGISMLHPWEKVIGMFFQNKIWSRLLDINRLCLVCIKISIEEVKKCQISKHGYHQGPSDETLKKARCQFCDVKFGHRIMEAVGFFDYKMHSFIQITFNFTNKWSKGVVWWFSDMILHKWYFRKS